MIFLVALLQVSFSFGAPAASAITANPETETVSPALEPLDVQIKQGLVEENGFLYFYNDDGTLFTQGYKVIETDGNCDRYYFLGNGQAFTSGYKTVEIDGVTYYYFFEDNGKAFTGGLKTVSFGPLSYSYFFGDDGRAVTSDWITHNGATYYFQDNGRAATGWFCDGENYYYAAEDGSLSVDTVVQGYKLDAEGKSVTKFRINEIVKQHTDPAMTDQEKIDALYDWVLTNDMTYLRTYEHASADWVWYDGWIDDFAANLMDNWGGNCYRYAAFMGMLIREATGLEVKVYQGETPAVSGGLTYHGWSAVNQNGSWYIYDVELQKHSDFSSDLCYKVPAVTSDTHLNGEGFNLY